MAHHSAIIVDPDLASASEYLSLLKPRVMSLVVFTAFVGAHLAPGAIHPFLLLSAIICIALGAGASGAINMWYDRDIDALMRRTQHRPLPAGKIGPSDALGFGVVLAAASVITIGLATNYITAFLLAFTIAFYVFVYTMWLKRRTPQNIVIGGAAGALPPLIGWTAVTGTLSIEPFILFAIIFLWTPPHFWALALFQVQDYSKAHIPMMPIIAGIKSTKKQILLYSLLLTGTSLVPYFTGMCGIFYMYDAVGLGITFICLAIRLYRHDDLAHARQLFQFSIVYLFLLFTLMIAPC